MRTLMLVCGLVAASALGCADNTAGARARSQDDANRAPADAPRDSSQRGSSGATDMPGGGRGGDHRPAKH